MPHALSMPPPGFQAIILCGPGSSFPTFTANPDENPKALIPIANRPMVWYPIEFCYRMGVTSESLSEMSYVFSLHFVSLVELSLCCIMSPPNLREKKAGGIPNLC